MGWGPISDQKSTGVMNAILDAEAQQLVVLNGDLITGENTHLENSTSYLDIIVQPLVQRGLLWASTYGNHDQQFNLSTKALLRREQQRYPGLSLTKSMVQSPNAGTSNYYLPVYGKSKGSRVPVLLLWFFDSRGGSVFQEVDSDGVTVAVPGFVDDSVCVTSLLFLCIRGTPSNQYCHLRSLIASARINRISFFPTAQYCKELLYTVVTSIEGGGGTLPWGRLVPNKKC